MKQDIRLIVLARMNHYGYNQSKLSALSGVAQPSINMWLRCKNKSIRVSSVEAIFDVLKIKITF